MKLIGLRQINGAYSGCGCRFWNTKWQWQPTTDTHDPNPPITLLDVPVVPPAGGARNMMLLGVGCALMSVGSALLLLGLY